MENFEFQNIKKKKIWDVSGEEKFARYLKTIGNGQNMIPNIKFIEVNQQNVIDKINKLIDFCYSKNALDHPLNQSKEIFKMLS